MNRRSYLALAAAGLAGCRGRRDGASASGTSDGGDGAESDDGAPAALAVETVATGLEVPWGAAYRDGVLHLTERPGRIVRVADGTVERVADLTDAVAVGGEGGLLGLAVAPADPDVAYTYETYEADGGRRNRIVRREAAAGWRGETLLGGLPGARIHDGGRLAVAPGGDALYATCGDASAPERAQDPDSLHGTVLRLTLDGEPHPDNPSGTAVFSHGHRNPQGLAFRGGEVYATEHGPDRNDEINHLRAGGNYGWPVVGGEATGDGEYVPAVTAYTPTIAPGGGTFYPPGGPVEPFGGDLFFGTLAGEHLHRTRITADDEVRLDERLYAGRFGRLRTTFVGPDGGLHVVTSNRDGRGSPRENDDRVLRLRPAGG